MSRKATLSTAKYTRVVFLCLKHYLINVNTNVSNAKMNIPKAIRSLKSKCFISITPHSIKSIFNSVLALPPKIPFPPLTL